MYINSIWPKTYSQGERFHMVSWLWKCVRTMTACLLSAVFAVPQSVVAQTHLVSPEELERATVAATRARQQSIETILQFFSSTAAERALKSAHMDQQRVKQAVSSLSDQELAQLASRASKAQADFSAG